MDVVFAGVPTFRVGLDCDVDTLLQSEWRRAGRWGGLVTASLDVHEGWSYDTGLDMTALSPEAIATEICERVS